MPQRDYSKLLGRMKELGITQQVLAEQIGINTSTINIKLNSKGIFTQSEILAIVNTLGISDTQIGEYFFTQKV